MKKENIGKDYLQGMKYYKKLISFIKNKKNK